MDAVIFILVAVTNFLYRLPHLKRNTMNLYNKDIFRFCTVLFIISISSCSPIVMQREAINLDNLLATAKNCADPAELEHAINDTNNHITTVDLDGDGVIDYLKICENNNGLLEIRDDISESKDVSIGYIDASDYTHDEPGEIHAGIYAHMEVQTATSTRTLPLMASDVLFGYFAEPHICYISDYKYKQYPPYFYTGRSTRKLNSKRITDEGIAMYAQTDVDFDKNRDFVDGFRLHYWNRN